MQPLPHSADAEPLLAVRLQRRRDATTLCICCAFGRPSPTPPNPVGTYTFTRCPSSAPVRGETALILPRLGAHLLPKPPNWAFLPHLPGQPRGTQEMQLRDDGLLEGQLQPPPSFRDRLAERGGARGQRASPKCGRPGFVPRSPRSQGTASTTVDRMGQGHCPSAVGAVSQGR